MQHFIFDQWEVSQSLVPYLGGKNKVTCSLILDQQHSTGKKKKKINDPVTVTQELKYDVPNMLMKFTKTKPKNI